MVLSEASLQSELSFAQLRPHVVEDMKRPEDLKQCSNQWLRTKVLHFSSLVLTARDQGQPGKLVGTLYLRPILDDLIEKTHGFYARFFHIFLVCSAQPRGTVLGAFWVHQGVSSDRESHIGAMLWPFESLFSLSCDLFEIQSASA